MHRKRIITIIMYCVLVIILLCIFWYTKIIIAGQTSAKSGYNKIGEASWYGAELQGEPTATGKNFDMHALTAASRELPIGSYVKVTNLANNKSVVVKITDKGPFTSNRIIDISHAAANQLGIIGQGVARVRVEAINAPKN